MSRVSIRVVEEQSRSRRTHLATKGDVDDLGLTAAHELGLLAIEQL
jgi:hypothetical protein